MYYQDRINTIRLIGRAENRVLAVKLHYADKIAHIIAETSKTLTTSERNKLVKQSVVKTVENFVSAGYVSLTDFNMLGKADAMLKDYASDRKHHINSLTVSLSDGFVVKTISPNKHGVMVSISHPSLKTNVTRHLRKQGSRLSGYAPFGANIIIPYHLEEQAMSKAA